MNARKEGKVSLETGVLASDVDQLDWFSRLVVGWAMDQHNDEGLIRRALEMALIRRSPPKQPLLHSD